MEKGKRLIYIISYLVIWAVMVTIFWIGGISDAMGYSIMTLYIVLPMTTLIISFLLGKDRDLSNMKWLLIIFFGIIYMLAYYTTFSLANMLTFNKFNLPDIVMILPGLILSLIGIGLGSIYSSRMVRDVDKDSH